MPKDAAVQSEIDDFADQFGERYLFLACHAAFPLVLNPDLLYRLWANFQRDAHGRLLGIPWIAVADLLLSSLCEEIAYETYRMPDPMRNLLLERLHEDERFRAKGRDRLLELGEFMRQYVQNDLNSPRQSVREVAEAQLWTADVYTQPQALVQSITETYGGLQPTNRPEYLRLAALLQIFNAPLTGWAKPDDATSERFQVLVVYSQGMASHVRGNEVVAKEYLGQVAGKMDLPMPAGVAPEPEEKPRPRSRRDLIQAMQTQAVAQPRGLEGIVDRIRAGRCVPILSSWLDFEVVFGVSEEQLRTSYAESIQYPLPAPYRLEQLTEYRRTIMQRDRLDTNLDFLSFVKTLIYQTAEQAGLGSDILIEARAQMESKDVTGFANLLEYPRFQDGVEDPLLSLATLPLPIYVTTSYFRFLEDALRRANKNPRSESCRLTDEANLASESQLDPTYAPSVAEPLVYHVFGIDMDPSTLVLTEDDYLGYLMEIAGSPDLIPPAVRSSLAASSPLCLGHDLDDLRWSVLDHTILQSRPGRQRSVGVFQLDGDSKEERRVVETYLGRSGLTAFWDSSKKLLSDVSNRLATRL